MRRFAQTAISVSAIGIGGSHLGEAPDENEAIRIVHEAIDAGINFFDNAWEYHDGKSEEILGRALVGKRDGVFLMTKVCTHGRDRSVAMKQLEDSLRRLGTDHLDLWQVHECIYDNDPELHFAKGGVIEALEQAKKAGEGPVRRLHRAQRPEHPPGHARALVPLRLGADAAQLLRRNLSQLRAERGARGDEAGDGRHRDEEPRWGGQAVQAGVVGPEEALRYAMSVPGVTVTVSGIDSIDILRQNLAIARGFEPMQPEEMKALRARVAWPASDGHFELYKTTKHFDAKEGREQHGYPSVDELPL